MRAARRGERTVLTDVYRTAPFHPGPLHQRGGIAEVILQEVSPGLFPGDRLDVHVEVAAGAALAARGQGATKVYPATTGLGAETKQRFSVAEGGTLWWLPGALIPFRDARLSTRTDVVLAGNSRFACLEVITPGRVAMGERFAYGRLDLRLRVEVGGAVKLIERVLLDPRERPSSTTESLGGFSCAGSLVLVGYPCPGDLDNFGDGVWLGAGGTPDLVIVRGLAHAAEPLRNALLTLLRMVENRAAEVTAAAADSEMRH